MSKNNENKLVPKYRFPEFANHGNWQEKSFSQLFEFGNGKDYKHLLNGDIPVYGTGGKMLSVNDYLFDGESVCIGRKGTIDSPLFLTGKFWTVDTLFYTHSFVNSKPKFIYYIFQNVNWYDYNEAGGVPSLSKTTIKQIKTLIPPRINEQEKIVACLSSLDEVIKTESQKLEVLKEHKKGLLQNLLPQAGETVPKFRFKEFENSGEWQETTLGEIGEPLMCKRIFKEETTPNPKDGIPFYKIGTFGRLADSYIPKEIYEEYKSKYSFPKIGDILISASGTIGRLVVYDGSPAYFQDSNIIWLGHSEEKILNRFLLHCYTNMKWQTSDGGVISRLYNSDFKRMKISFPEDPKEQDKIADTLSSIDDLINAQNQKLESLQLHKKGLLQGLFPNLNEVTA